MDTRIMRITFNKDSSNRTILSDKSNLEKIRSYILPIIEMNLGWGTFNLTETKFNEKPDKYQDDIDASTWDNVHILLIDDKPVGMLEYSRVKVPKILDSLSSDNLLDIGDRIGLKLSFEDVNPALEFLKSKPIYSSIGIVLKSEFQGRKSGYANILYQILSDGINFGWTSNPLIVRLKRKLYTHTLYFPLFDELPNSKEYLAMCLLLWADLKTKDRNDTSGLLFGTMHSKYFVEDRGEEYLNIADRMEEMGKISYLDNKRIKYVLSMKRCAGAIFSWN